MSVPNNFSPIQIPEELLEGLVSGDHSSDDLEDVLSEFGLFYLSDRIDNDSVDGLIKSLLIKHNDKSWKGDILLLINSEGGSASAGWALIDIMKIVRMNIITVGLGCVASMGAIILAAGDTRKILPSTEIMLHQFSGGVPHQPFSQIKSQMKGMELEQQRHISFWKEHSRFTDEEEIKRHLLKPGEDNFLSPQEALDLGLVDEIIEWGKKRMKENG